MAFDGDAESEDVLRLFAVALISSDSSRVRFPSDPVSLLSSMALLSISSSSYAASRLFMVARRFVLSEHALCIDFPSLRLDLSRLDDEEQASGEEASRTGRYCEHRGPFEFLRILWKSGLHFSQKYSSGLMDASNSPTQPPCCQT